MKYGSCDKKDSKDGDVIDSCKDLRNECDDVTEKDCEITPTCCDVARLQQLVTEVFEYISANNPSAMWRSDREKKLLEDGLQPLSKEEREILRKERIFHKVEENIINI